MGGSSYSKDAYDSRYSSSKTDPKGYFHHDVDVKSGTVAAKVHEKLDPSITNSAGKLTRESFDSDAHPETRSIVVQFDTTGSMSTLPKLFVEKLGKLVAGLVKRGIEHPQVLFAANGDAYCDPVPLQIGQFESGNEMDEQLSLFALLGGGGSQQTESYELAWYYFARHTNMDCVTKRNEKAFLFVIGDELPYDEVNPDQVEAHIGYKPEKAIPTTEILEELRRSFEVFWFMPHGASNYSNRSITEPLKAMFGQNYIELENPAEVCEQIIGLVAAYEGIDLDDIAKGLKDLGADSSTVDRVTNAISKWTPPATAKAAVASARLATTADDGVTRL